MRRRLRRSQENVRSITQRRRKTLKPPKDLFQARIFLERPVDQTSGTVAILDISRNYLEREEVAFGVDEGIALNAFNFLARIVADRINGDPPCMGRFLSRGCPTGPINILRRSFFCEPGQPLPFVQSRLGWGTFSPGHFSSSIRAAGFPSPRPRSADAGARRSSQGWRVAPPRRGVSLNGFEHDGTLERVGDDGVRGELRVGARSIVPHPCMRRVKDPDHDAGIRIGSKLRGGGPILFPGIGAMGGQRDTATSNRHRRPVTDVRTGAETVGCSLIGSFLQCAGRRITPSGTTPSLTKCHKAISSLRAKATIIFLRDLRAFAVRASNHLASALSFW